MSDISKETFEEVVKRIDENVEEIKIQTTETNGSVRTLQIWKAKAQGAIIVISIIITGILIPLALKYLSISLFS